MANITLHIPSEIKEILSKHPEIKRDKIVTDTLWGYAKKLRLMDKITAKSELSNQSVEKLDKVIKADLWKRWNEIKNNS
jgi:hypothetical protein